MTSERPARILVIRRDNIGDLVCTTPLLRALRHQLPQANIAALVTRYNRAVLDGNPDVDEVFSYTKAKHRAPGESVLGGYLERLGSIWRMRRARFDWVLLPGGAQASALRFARWIAPRRLAVRGAAETATGPHEVEQTCALLTALGLEYEAPGLRLKADEARAARLSMELRAARGSAPRRVVGIHISARRRAQRWPVDHFARLMRELHANRDCVFMLLWAPGPADDPLHPGDDDKAAAVMAACGSLPIFPAPTSELPDLIAALSLCDRVICADGGAMHLAAGLGKPIVCLFADSPAERWHPWSVPYELLQSDHVEDIPASAVAEALVRLDGRI